MKVLLSNNNNNNRNAFCQTHGRFLVRRLGQSARHCAPPISSASTFSVRNV